MQLFIDLNVATPAQLRDMAEMLTREANRYEFPQEHTAPVNESDEGTRTVGTAPEMAAPFGPALDPAYTFNNDVDTGRVPLDPAVVFAQPSHFPPIPPPETAAPLVPPPPVTPAPPPSLDEAAGGGASLPATDKDGLPHDSRIHSANPTLNSDGRWRRRRGLDNATLLAVEAELRSRENTQVMVPPPPPVIPPPPPSVAAPNAPAPTVIPPPPVGTPPPPVAGSVLPSAPADPFRELMRVVSPHTGEGGRLALAAMKPIHAEFGATSWADYVAKCRDKIPALMARIEGMLKA